MASDLKQEATAETKAVEKKEPKFKHKCFLSRQITVLHAKAKTEHLVILSLTDFTHSAKVIFDRQKKEVLRNPFNLQFSQADTDKLMAWLG